MDLRRTRRRSVIERYNRTGYIFILPWVIGFAVLLLQPLIQTVQFSFSEVDITASGYTTDAVGWEHFFYAFREDASFPKLLANSVVSMLTDVPILLIFSFFAAVLLRKNFRGCRVVKGIFFITVIMSSGVFIQMQNETIAANTVQLSAAMNSAAGAASSLKSIDIGKYLVDAGITSLKIEGRAKSAYYVSVVTNAYRQAVDQYVADPENYHLAGWLAEEVYKVSHREYCTGFYYGRPDQCYLSGGYVRECDIVAVVDHCADGWLYGTQRNRFAVGDEVEILEPGQPPYKLTVAEIRNGEGESVPAAPHAMMAFSMPCPEGSFTQGTIIRKNKN